MDAGSWRAQTDSPRDGARGVEECGSFMVARGVRCRAAPSTRSRAAGARNTCRRAPTVPHIVTIVSTPVGCSRFARKRSGVVKSMLVTLLA
eukprot:3725175-Prymnesium_polylepis.2